MTGQVGDHLAFAREDAGLIVEGDRAEMLDHELRHCVVTGLTSRADYQKRLRAHLSSPQRMVEVAQMRGRSPPPHVRWRRAPKVLIYTLFSTKRESPSAAPFQILVPDP